MFRVTLDQFEGPLDLLLFFVRRDELDIHDIPIARIADEYLDAVRGLDALARDPAARAAGVLDLDAAADFIYTAALLIQIKTRMLMPRPETDGEPVDPRAELVDRLLEYVRFKEAAGVLEGRFEARQRLVARGQASDERERYAEPAETTFRATLFDLVSALGTALARSGAPPPDRHTVEREAYALDVQRAYVLARLSAGAASFAALVAGEGRAFVVTTFLAVLDLAQRQAVRLVFGAAPEDFALELADPVPDPVAA